MRVYEHARSADEPVKWNIAQNVRHDMASERSIFFLPFSHSSAFIGMP